MKFKLFESKDINARFVSLIEAKEPDFTEALRLLDTENIENSGRVSLNQMVFNDELKRAFKQSDNRKNWADFLRFALARSDHKKYLFQAILYIVNVSPYESSAELIRSTFSQGSEREQNEMINVLTGYHPTLYPKVLALFKEFYQDKFAEIYKKLAVSAFKKSNANLLYELRQTNPSMFEEFINDKNINDKEREKIHYFLSLDPSSRDFLSHKMSSFVRGYGTIDYEAALLTVAQINSRKSIKENVNERYQFNPTVLQEDEFEEYLKLLKTSPTPLRERFMIAGVHWLSGDIEIDSKGQAKLLIIDPFGEKTSYDEKDDAIRHIANVFADNERTIYFAIEQRQGSTLDCYIFALDDCRHLFTVEKYLREIDDEYIKSGLFGYLDNAKKGIMRVESEEGPIEVIRCHLPLSLVRSMQSREIRSVILSRPIEEKIAIVNKRGQTAEKSVEEHMQEVQVEEKGTKEQNRRLDYVLDKFAKKNLEYLMSHTVRDVQTEMNKFTLAALKTRLQAQKQEQKSSATTKTFLHSSVITEEKIENFQKSFNKKISILADAIIGLAQDFDVTVPKKQLLARLDQVLKNADHGRESSIVPEILPKPNLKTLEGIVSRFLQDAWEIHQDIIRSSHGRISGKELQEGFAREFIPPTPTKGILDSQI